MSKPITTADPNADTVEVSTTAPAETTPAPVPSPTPAPALAEPTTPEVTVNKGGFH